MGLDEPPFYGVIYPKSKRGGWEMDAGVTRQEALELMQEYLRAENLRKHCLATEAIMRALAERLGFDAEPWGIAGLLHDLDYEETREDPSHHGLKTEAILKEKGVNQEIIDAIKAHNAEALGIERKTELDFALTCAECITGMAVATTLVYPDKKIASVKPKSILKRMKQKEFARNVNRDHIRKCEKLNIPVEEFAELSLKAMGTISDELGL
jgi:putative nucleotidyltransferase with HDIG domain